jgi:hypothetical protein
MDDFGGAVGRAGGGEIDRGFDLHRHKLAPGSNRHGNKCWYPDEAPRAPPWPPFCY